MTNKEKKLLIVDLCARLPYGLKVGYGSWETDYGVSELTGFRAITRNGHVDYVFLLGDTTQHDADEIKPYLRPLCSITEGERKEFLMLPFSDVSWHERTDWLNAHHFDFRGLIPMGLALPASKDIYETE